MNGDKIIPITAFSGVARTTLRWGYRMGAGLGALELECEHQAATGVSAAVSAGTKISSAA